MNRPGELVLLTSPSEEFPATSSPSKRVSQLVSLTRAGVNLRHRDVDD